MLAIFGDTPENFSKVPLKNGLKFRKKGTVLMVMTWKGNGCYLIGESWVRFFHLKQEIDRYTLTQSDYKSGNSLSLYVNNLFSSQNLDFGCSWYEFAMKKSTEP